MKLPPFVDLKFDVCSAHVPQIATLSSNFLLRKICIGIVFLSLLFGASEDAGYLLTISGAPSKAMSVALEEPKKKERRLLLPWRRDSNVNEGLNASNVIAVEVRDKTLRCYVNGAFITTVTTPEPPVGRVGVALSAGVEAVFTRLVVSELGPE